MVWQGIHRPKPDDPEPGPISPRGWRPWIPGFDLKSCRWIRNLPFDFFLFRRLILIGWYIFWTERHAIITTVTLWRSAYLWRSSLNNKYFFSIFEDWNWNLILNLRIVRKLNPIIKIILIGSLWLPIRVRFWKFPEFELLLPSYHFQYEPLHYNLIADWTDESGVGGENIAEVEMNLKNLEMSSDMD